MKKVPRYELFGTPEVSLQKVELLDRMVLLWFINIDIKT